MVTVVRVAVFFFSLRSDDGDGDGVRNGAGDSVSLSFFSHKVVYYVDVP